MISEVRVYLLDGWYININDKAPSTGCVYTEQSNKLLEVNLESLAQGAKTKLLLDEKGNPYSIDKITIIEEPDRRKARKQEPKYHTEKNLEFYEIGSNVTINTGADKSNFYARTVLKRKRLSVNTFTDFMTMRLGWNIIENDMKTKEISLLNEMLPEGESFTKEQVLSYGLLAYSHGIKAKENELSRKNKRPYEMDIFNLESIK